VPNPFNNLDVKIELRNAKGQVVASASPATSFDATVTFKVKQGGTHYVVVSSAGPSSASTATNRGLNVGTYTLTGTYVPLSDPIKIYAPLRWSFDAATGTTSGYLTIAKAPFSLKGPFSVEIKLPSDSIQWLSPRGVQRGDTVIVRVDKDLVIGKPTRFFVRLRNPDDVPLGTFFVGLIVKLG
jgi:hypothetical protein